MHDDLLRQARRLARLEQKRPKQASLRCALSTAYYGVFHFLVDQSCRAALGTQHEMTAYRQTLGRAFTHMVIKDACESFAGGTLKSVVARGLPKSFLIPLEIRSMARVFVDLQQRRHIADYDLTVRFSRSDVLTAVQQAEAAVQGFKQLAVSNEKKFFLACLWAWGTLGKR